MKRRPFWKDLDTPLIHVERVWLRRATVVAISWIVIWFYLAEGLYSWWKDLRDIWTGKIS